MLLWFVSGTGSFDASLADFSETFTASADYCDDCDSMVKVEPHDNCDSTVKVEPHDNCDSTVKVEPHDNCDSTVKVEPHDKTVMLTPDGNTVAPPTYGYIVIKPEPVDSDPHRWIVEGDVLVQTSQGTRVYCNRLEIY